MKKGILLILLITLMLSGCSYNYFMNDSDEEPIIKVVNNEFDATVEEWIKILNEDIEDENLTLIQEDYEVSKYQGCLMYKSLINDKLAIRFIKNDEENANIGIVQLIVLESYTNTNRKDKINIKATDDDYEKAAEYYRIICNNVDPRFEAERFLKAYNDNGGVYDNDVLVFSCKKNISLTDVGTNEEISLYQMFGSKDLFEKYENDLWDDDNQYFYY